MIEKWLSENTKDSVMGRYGGDLSISGIAPYQPSDGLVEFKVVKVNYLLFMQFLECHVHFCLFRFIINANKLFDY